MYRLIIAGFLMLSSIHASIIFSNFGPGIMYGPDGVGTGFAPGDPAGANRSYGTGFTVTGQSYRLTDLNLPLGLISGTNAVQVAITADNVGSPGAVLESFLLTSVGPPQSPLSLILIPSALHPILNEGSQYWVTVSGGAPDTFALWALTLSGITGPAAAKLFPNDPWSVNINRTGALQVGGDTVVPEPSTILLLSMSLLSLAASRKRRSGIDTTANADQRISIRREDTHHNITRRERLLIKR